MNSSSEHHYNDTESNYFVLFTLAVVLFPYTYWFIKNKVLRHSGGADSVQCKCSLCEAGVKPIKSKQGGLTCGTILHFVVLAGLWIVFAMLVANVGSSTTTEAKKTFDPYEILGLEEGATPEQVKKAYRTMSLLYHPDKAADPTDPEVQARYINIVKANEALTDPDAIENLKKYGNPDGPQPIVVGIALPSWLVKKDNTLYVLGVYLSLLIVGLPSVVCCWWRSWKKYDSTKVMNETMAIYYHKVEPMTRSKAVAELIAVSVENKQIPVRSTDEANLAKAFKKIPENHTPTKKKNRYNFTVPYGVKALALFYAHIGRAHKYLSAGLKEDLTTLLLQSRNLIAGFITICTARLYFTPLTECIALLQMITQAGWKGEALLQLPHITPQMAENFASKKKNCGTLPQLAALDPEKRKTYLKDEGLNDAQIADVETVLAYLPLDLDFTVDFRVEGEENDGKIPAKSVVTCFYKVFRGKDDDAEEDDDDDGGFFSDSGSEGEDEKQKKERREKRKIRQQKKKQEAKDDEVKRYVHAPYFPESREESWWLIIGDSASQKLIGVQKVGSFGKKSEGKVRFLAPEQPGAYNLILQLMCDGYIGCDKSKQKKIVVVAEDALKKQQALVAAKEAEDIKEDSDASDFSDDDSGSLSEND